VRNEDKLLALGIYGKERFYYLRFGKKSLNYPLGIATVCLIPVEGAKKGTVYVRGVAFCSPRDQFNRRQGRNIALGRAVQAMESQLNRGYIRKGNPCSILTQHYGWVCLAEWDAALALYEKKIMKEVTKKNEADKG